MRSVAAKANRNDLEFLATLLENGKIKPVIDRKYPLDKTSEAMNYLSQGHSTGKVVITIDQ
jgi:NADPH:quinone reductase-like Zn-dependent oxidoreductase